MSNTNCKNMENSDSCYSCNSCNYCNYCDSCYSCNYCNSCNSCNYCNSCNSCYYCNYCNSCKGLRMSEYMIFCLGEGRSESKGIGYQQNHMVFNTKVSDKEYNKIRASLPEIKISHTYWVDEKDMTKEEKKENEQYKKLGGFLKRISYEEAWANWWNDASKKEKQAILDIPQFDADIFKGITGIDISKDKKADKKKQELIDKAEQLQKKAQELLDTANEL